MFIYCAGASAASLVGSRAEAAPVASVKRGLVSEQTACFRMSTRVNSAETSFGIEFERHLHAE